MSLIDKHIIVTRPTHQNQMICQRLTQLGACAYRLPLLTITAIHHTLPKQAPDYIIFTSPNAVKFGIQPLAPYLATTDAHHSVTQTTHPISVAIGHKTAKALQQNNVIVDIYPQAGQLNSEQLLTNPIFQHLPQRTVWIIRGQNGRDLLATTLKERGAQVNYIDVYYRSRPKIDIFSLKTQWLKQEIDMIMITSAESLHNLYQSSRDSVENNDWINHLPLLLGSQRMQSIAQQLGHYGTLCIAENPSDEAMVQALMQHFS